MRHDKRKQWRENMDAIVFILFQIFLQHAQFWKLGNITRIFRSFNWGIFSHVMRLDQSRATENTWWIIRKDNSLLKEGTSKLDTQG